MLCYRLSVVIVLCCYLCCSVIMVFYVLIVCTVTLPPGVNPIAVDKYIYIYHQERQIVSIQPLVAVNLCRWWQNDSYQRLYWHNLSLLMMSTMCLKHVETFTQPFYHKLFDRDVRNHYYGLWSLPIIFSPTGPYRYAAMLNLELQMGNKESLSVLPLNRSITKKLHI